MWVISLDVPDVMSGQLVNCSLGMGNRMDLKKANNHHLHIHIYLLRDIQVSTTASNGIDLLMDGDVSEDFFR